MPYIGAVDRSIAIGALIVLAGCLLVQLLQKRDGTVERQLELLTRKLAITVPVLLALHFIMWTVVAADGEAVNAEWVLVLSGTTTGKVHIARFVAAVAATVFVLVGRLAPASLFVFLAICATAATGHSLSFSPLVAFPSKLLHLLASAAWACALLWIIATQQGRTFATVAARASRIALYSVVVVVATGVLLSVLFVESFEILFSTAYGWTLVAKVVGTLLLLCMGAYHRFALIPSINKSSGNDKLQHSVKRELVLFMVVVLAAGVLASLSPHEER